MMKEFASEEYINHKTRFFSALLIFFVIMQHAVNINGRITGFSQSEGFNFYMQSFVSAGISIVAVPLFFIISGYYFFYHVQTFTFDVYKEKVKKRIGTLVIPYFIVSIWAFLLLYTLQHISALKPFFKYGLIEDYGLYDYVYALVIHPLAYQLWFLRNLFCIILVTPVLYFLIKKAGKGFIIALLVLWILFTEKFSDGILTTITFFSAGAYFALSRIQLPKLNNPILVVSSLLVWLSLILIFIIYSNSATGLFHYLDELSVLAGIFALWCLYDVLKISYNVHTGFTAKIAVYTFFIYLFHEPLLSMILKLLFVILGKTILSSTVIYWLAPLITIFSCLCFAILLKKYFPSIYTVINGGR